jgi:predicted nucleic acid-binding protein
VIYILDACALIAILKNEPEMRKVKDLFVQANNGTASICMHIINKMEVYYGFITERGLLEADKLMKIVEQLPIKYISTINRKVYKIGCRFKGTYSISLADAIAAATACDTGATLVTKDGEFKPLQGRERLSIFWLKQPGKKGA